MKPSTSLRNKPCPCGSSKKFKHCHGTEARTAEQRQEANRKWLAALEARQEEVRKTNPSYRKSARLSPVLAMYAAILGGIR